MKISPTMDTGILAEMMGDCATEQEAQKMRDMLVRSFDGMETFEVPDSLWFDLLEKCLTA